MQEWMQERTWPDVDGGVPEPAMGRRCGLGAALTQTMATLLGMHLPSVVVATDAGDAQHSASVNE